MVGFSKVWYQDEIYHTKSSLGYWYFRCHETSLGRSSGHRLQKVSRFQYDIGLLNCKLLNPRLSTLRERVGSIFVVLL